MNFKGKGQRLIQITGVAGLALGILTMLRIPTIILPPWFLVLLFLPILLAITFTLGLATKSLVKSQWSTLTFTSLFTGLACIAFYISEYRPTHKIIVANHFSGTVILLLANDNTDDFTLNEYGVGYVSENTYRNGFKPVVEKDGDDITSEILNLSSGSMAHATGEKVLGPYKYLSFIVPGQPTDSINNDLIGLIEKNAIDTTRLIKE